MKSKHLSLAIAALLAAGGLWLAWSAWRTQASGETSREVPVSTNPGTDSDPNRAGSLSAASQAGPAAGSNNGPANGQVLTSPAPLAPPTPNRRFTDFTPEQRVQFARQGHGPGG